jgi:hypothetical protein
MRRFWFIVGAVLIVLGALSLLNVLFAALGIMFRIGWLFWPIILIGIGAWLITGFTRGDRQHSEVPREQASIPLEGAAEATVTVRHGAGRLTIGAGAAPDQLLAGSFGGGLDAAKTNTGGRLKLDMRVKDRDVSRYIFGPWHHGWAGKLDWDFTLNPSIPLILKLETGASETRLSLTDLQVRELSVKTGASSTTVDLPGSAGHTRMHVESGAAAVKIRVPQNVAATILVKSALAGVHIDATRFPPAAGGYRSANYEGAANKVEILVETGVGSIDIS